MPIFHSHRAVAERAGVNDVGPSGVKDVCYATDTNLFQGEESPEGIQFQLLGVEWVKNNLLLGLAPCIVPLVILIPCCPMRASCRVMDMYLHAAAVPRNCRRVNCME